MNMTLITAAALALGLAASPAMAGGDAAAGKEKSAACASCHGADGNSASPGFPKLAGQYADYITKALIDYKSGARQNAIMQGFAAGLSEQDMEDLGAYFAKQADGVYIIPRR